MFSSSTFNNSTTTTSPIFYVDNIVSYLIDDESTNYSTSYYHIPSSPFTYNEIDNYGGFITNNHDELTLLQQSILASNNINDNNNNNNNSSIDHTDDSSIFEVDNKVDCSNKGSGDHHEVEVNGIVDDNGEMNHHNISSTTTTTTTTNNSHHHGLIMKKKRRTSNKDRHSKIRTAHGLRDRRMRLSLQVARPFFKLQDLLGFDKASTTVEWLLMQSKPAIDELIQVKHGSSPSSGVTTTTNKCNTPISSSNSDDYYCDVESTTNEDREGDHNNNSMRKRVMKDEPKQKETKRKRTTKEERKVARERAKKRTLERMQTRGNNHPFTSLTNYQQQCFHDASYCQKNVPNYLISTQHNTMRGPQ